MVLSHVRLGTVIVCGSNLRGAGFSQLHETVADKARAAGKNIDDIIEKCTLVLQGRSNVELPEKKDCMKKISEAKAVDVKLHGIMVHMSRFG